MIHVEATFKKGHDNRDVVAIKNGEHTCVLKTWKMFMPHEILHLVVESEFGLAGFVHLVAAGHDPENLGPRQVSKEALLAEALVGYFQSEMGGGSLPEMTYQERIGEELAKHNIACPAFDKVKADRVRELLRRFHTQWKALQVGEKMIIRTPIA